MSHTPGPWEWTHDAEPYSSQWTLSPGVMLVDGTDGTPGGDDIDRANARLIAAAPDLAETERKLANEVGGLRAFEDEIRSIIGNTNWSVLMQRLGEADAAIAKAEGRS